jgi:hypothetical protein
MDLYFASSRKGCIEGELTVLKPIPNMHIHLLSSSLYGALPKNSIVDVYPH